MQRAINLTLSTALYYKASSSSLDELARKTDNAEIGYDAFVSFHYSFRDEMLKLVPVSSGEREGYTEEERRIIENGGMIERKANESEEIPAGRYLFEQLPFIPSEKDLARIILPYARTADGSFYIRLFKENMLECIAQLLFPSA